MGTSKSKLSKGETNKLLKTLKDRFEQNPARHKSKDWKDVEKKLSSNKNALPSLHLMEASGGEPDVVDFKNKKSDIIFVDCSVESPAGRRSLCYDEAALKSRKKDKPKGSALGMAKEMGVAILTEEEYREWQKTGEYDLKTSSWVETPEAIRKEGGALFCDRRYKVVFTYHNGAESYYAARGFRAKISL